MITMPAVIGAGYARKTAMPAPVVFNDHHAGGRRYDASTIDGDTGGSVLSNVCAVKDVCEIPCAIRGDDSYVGGGGRQTRAVAG